MVNKLTSYHHIPLSLFIIYIKLQWVWCLPLRSDVNTCWQYKSKTFNKEKILWQVFSCSTMYQDQLDQPKHPHWCKSTLLPACYCKLFLYKLLASCYDRYSSWWTSIYSTVLFNPILESCQSIFKLIFFCIPFSLRHDWHLWQIYSVSCLGLHRQVSLV